MIPNVIDPELYWLTLNPWVFWLIVNVFAYLAYRISRYGIGVGALLFPVITCIVTVAWGEPWWTGLIGVGFVGLALFPLVFEKSGP